MNGRHRRTYSLSTTGNELVNQVSPIAKDPYRTFALNGARDIARTSTPLPKSSTWKKDIQPNGDLGLFTHSSTPLIKKQSPTRSENTHTLVSQQRSEEALFGPKGSPWGPGNSPKIRERPVGVKTVQNVAGPLLASTRYNIDPKLYTDVSSPGLTTRLTKYAAEASNKLTHQTQYGAGQFPKVNLNATPAPLLSPKVARARIPVTVRVAPPEIINYSPVDTHHDRSSSSSSQELKESLSFPSVNKSMKKLPLKRHTSREDIMLDLAKKQRFERIYDGELENLEEMMQKRTREESTASDEDESPQSIHERPSKRPKASSCHDVINSLSSSMSVYTGIKRKAMDTSRCNTPNIEKHFKPSSTSPPRFSSLSLSSSGELARSKEQLNVKVPVITTIKGVSPEKAKETSPEVTKPDGLSPVKSNSQSPHNNLNLPTPKLRKEIPIAADIKPPAKLTEKLFMRAEPQDNEKIKSLIEEQGKIEPKFTTEDKEEIKKKDIVNMRQNSMRLRLQNMFDAISGKSSKIDPDVVIRAEEVNPAATSSYALLSSQTSTITVNTSPIATTIVPILKTDTETKSPTNKHVTFNLPSSQSSLSSNTSTVSSAEVTKPTETKIVTSVPNFNFSSSPRSAQTFNVGSIASTTASTTTTVSPSTTTSNFSFPASSSATSIATSKIESNLPTTTLSLSSPTSLFTAKPSSTSIGTTLSSTGFSFGSVTTKAATSMSTAASSAAPVTSFAITSPVAKTTENNLGGITSPSTFGNALAKSPISISLAQTTTSLPSFVVDKKEPMFSFGGVSSTPSINSATTTNQSSSTFSPTTTTTSMFSAGSNNTPSPAYNATSTVTTSTPATAPIFNFGGSSKPPGTFSFGAATSPAVTTAATTVTPTFGSGTVTAIGFGTSAASNPAATTSAPAFGSSTASLFGAQTTSAPNLFSGTGSTTTVSPMFKPPSSTATFGVPETTTTTSATSSIFGAPSSTSSFGATPSTTSTPSLFGSAVALAPSTSLFGNPSVTATMTPSAFKTTQHVSIFSGASISATGSATGATSIFGASIATAHSGLFSGSNASANQTSAANPADTGGVFGQSKSPTSITFGRSTSAFGSATAPSSFPALNAAGPSTLQVDAASSPTGSLPAFGSIKSTTQFGASTTTQPSTTSSGTSIFGPTATGGTFGANPTPGFGANVNATPTFGSTTSTNNAFGMSPTSSNVPTFGASSPSGFGSTANTPSPFGAPPTSTTTSPSLFGNAAVAGTSTAGPGANSTFSFGGSQPAQSAAPQPTSGSSFSFGSAAGSTGGPGIFQFGAANNANKPAGFNFNAPTAAPQINFTGNAAATPTFNAPAPNFQQPGTNMFSIGSGSSTPRSRGGRARRQR
uniref:Sensory neuron membrane protein s1 n=1 Tax=Chouioia cunea TaxID=1570515 RepID=A0A6B9CIV0_9HYME|nr:sensory neuron membrane protein s1 [Chouioia cunea]